jgi:hypothetical protein
MVYTGRPVEVNISRKDQIKEFYICMQNLYLDQTIILN